MTEKELKKLEELARKGVLVLRTENNPHLMISYKGSGGLVSPKWNVKVYTSGSVVCNDKVLLGQLLDGSLTSPDTSKKLLQVDDAGWGFPLSGVMVGVCDGFKVITDIVDVGYFKEGVFEKKRYLDEYSVKGMALVKRTGASPETHRIEICTGHINNRLRDDLRKAGYDVRVVEITGMLQDSLEDMFKDHIKQLTGSDLAYDPKNTKDVAERYRAVVKWAWAHAPGLLKTGWKRL